MNEHPFGFEPLRLEEWQVQRILGVPRGITSHADPITFMAHHWVPPGRLQEFVEVLIELAASGTVTVEQERLHRARWMPSGVGGTRYFESLRELAVCFETEEWERICGIDQSIVDRCLRERHQPEGEDREAWIYHLASYYVHGAQLDIEVPAGAGRDAERTNSPTRADIVVYRDRSRRAPWMVIEVKALGQSGGFLQAQSYARNLGAPYFAVSHGFANVELYETGLYGSESTPVEPGWGSFEQVMELLPNT